MSTDTCTYCISDCCIKCRTYKHSQLQNVEGILFYIIFTCFVQLEQKYLHCSKTRQFFLPICEPTAARIALKVKINQSSKDITAPKKFTIGASLGFTGYKPDPIK